MGRWARLVGWGFRWARRRSEGLSVSVSVSSTRSSGASVSGGEQLTVSEERREEERHARRCQGITKEGQQCRVLSAEHAAPLRAWYHGMFCAYHVGQGQEPGWRERLAEAQEEESYAPSRYALRAFVRWPSVCEWYVNGHGRGNEARKGRCKLVSVEPD